MGVRCAWDPSRRIRFSSPAAPNPLRMPGDRPRAGPLLSAPLYPRIDISRFIHAAPPSNSEGLSAGTEDTELPQWADGQGGLEPTEEYDDGRAESIVGEYLENVGERNPEREIGMGDDAAVSENEILETVYAVMEGREFYGLPMDGIPYTADPEMLEAEIQERAYSDTPSVPAPRPLAETQPPPSADPDGAGAGAVPSLAADTADATPKATPVPAAENPKEPSLPVTDLPYTICPAKWAAARAAAAGTPASFWSFQLYRGPPEGESEEPSSVRVLYCTTLDEMEDVCATHFVNEPVLGLDTEWMIYAREQDGPRANVSLVQIASPTCIALFHLALFKPKPEKKRKANPAVVDSGDESAKEGPAAEAEDDVVGVKDEVVAAEDVAARRTAPAVPPGAEHLVAPAFRRLMADPEVTKTGVWIRGDCNRLQKFLGVETRGMFELSHLYRLVRYIKQPQNVNKKIVRLAVQVEDYLGLPLYKGGVRTGNWSRDLKPDQIDYSASDAFACVQLYHVLERERKALNPCPPRPAHVERDLPLQLAEHEAVEAVSESAEASEASEVSDLEGMSETETSGSTDPPVCQETVVTTRETTIPRAPRKPNKKPAAPSAPGITDPPACQETFATAEAMTIPKQTKKLPRKPPNPPPPEGPTAQMVAPLESLEICTESATPSRRARSPKPAAKSLDPRVVAAERYLAEYRDLKTTDPEVAPSALRAYFIWRANPDLGPEDIAGLLREPPLATGTVAKYIVQAIRHEKLPYDRGRMHEELMVHLPNFVKLRYISRRL